MSGNKLKFAQKSIKKIIKHLTPEDSLNLITYSDKVNIVFENGDLTKKESLVSQVQDIYPTGNTNISSGLNTGFEVLLKSNKKKN